MALEKSAEKIYEFIPVYFNFARKAWGLEKESLKQVSRAYSLLFLSHICLIEREPLALNRIRQFTKYYTKLDYPDEPQKAAQVAELLVEELATHRFHIGNH